MTSCYDFKETDARIRAEIDGDFAEMAEQGGYHAESCYCDWTPDR